MENKKVFIVIPAYNEEKVITGVIAEIRAAGYPDIIVVDDGSADRTCESASATGVTALRHKINRGKGAAVKTGIEAAKLLGADVIVTMDGDGQHDPKDIEKLLRQLEKSTEVVLGTRLKNPEGMPPHKILANKIGNFFTWWLYGLWVTDSQSGFRVYSRRAANLIDTRTDRYEYDSEIIREIHRHHLKFAEVPIAVRYTEYSMGKLQKQNFSNGVKTVYKMIWNIIS
jgi:glycosyltransferase involved in cell wall biosynthesis